jgi:hypothetical protein
MKVSALLRRDGITYSLIFVLWAVVIYLVNAHHAYFGVPYPGVSFGQRQSPAAVMKSMTDVIARQRQVLASEKNRKKREQCLETIGATFFQLYDFTRKPVYLDSATLSCAAAANEDATAPSDHLVLGRIMTERKDYAAAKVEFEKVLSIDSTFPTVHYMLGEMALESNDLRSAVGHFEHETKIYAGLSASSKNTAANPADVRMAACFSSLRLANLYSTSFVNEQKAHDNFELYLQLETDPQRRQASIGEIRKYWKPDQSVNGSR